MRGDIVTQRFTLGYDHVVPTGWPVAWHPIQSAARWPRLHNRVRAAMRPSGKQAFVPSALLFPEVNAVEPGRARSSKYVRGAQGRSSVVGWSCAVV